MRWFLGLVLVVALVAGALYGVGRFLLPNELEVTRTVSIDRPRATVFAMSNDLNIAKEWSPYYAMDPNIQFDISPDPGQGQSMRWRSGVRDVGHGRMSIVSSTENEAIESIIELGDRAALNSYFALQPLERGTQVSWTVSADCAQGWINVPCRYMNLVLRGRIERLLDQGLAKLKWLAEQLPDVDFESFEIVEVRVDPTTVIFVDVSISSDRPTIQDRLSAENDGVAALDAFMNSTAGQVAYERQLVRVFPADNGIGGRYQFSLGYPFTGAGPARLVGVRVGETPGGAALRISYAGRRSLVPSMYPVIDAYMLAHRIAAREGAARWEIVTRVEPTPEGGDASDPIEHVDIYFPIARESTS